MNDRMVPKPDIRQLAIVVRCRRRVMQMLTAVPRRATVRIADLRALQICIKRFRSPDEGGLVVSSRVCRGAGGAACPSCRSRTRS